MFVLQNGTYSASFPGHFLLCVLVAVDILSYAVHHRMSIMFSLKVSISNLSSSLITTLSLETRATIQPELCPSLCTSVCRAPSPPQSRELAGTCQLVSWPRIWCSRMPCTCYNYQTPSDRETGCSCCRPDISLIFCSLSSRGPGNTEFSRSTLYPPPTFCVVTLQAF